MLGKMTGLFGRPVFLRAFHGWFTLVWLLMAVPAVLWWKDSVPFLVFVSVYANVTGHFSSWQAARVEARIEQDQS